MSSSSLTTTFDSEFATIRLTEECRLAEAAFGIDSAICWFMGRGSWRWECHTEVSGGDRIIIFKSLVPPKKLAFAAVGSLKSLAETGYLPKSLPDEELFVSPAEKKQEPLAIGQYRIIGRKSTGRETILISQQSGLYPDLQLCGLTYALSDTMVGLMVLGKHEFKWQGSLELAQLQVKSTLSPKVLTDYMASPKTAYFPEQFVKALK